MEPVDILTKRTGMSQEDAEYYLNLAAMRIRAYLSLPADADMTPYLFPWLDIATLMWQSDTSTQASSASLGYSKKSFTEGGVSKSESFLDGQAIHQKYDGEIDAILAGLKADGSVWTGGIRVW